MANKLEKKEFSVDEIFANPIFKRLVGSKADVEKFFDEKFKKTIKVLGGISPAEKIREYQNK